MCKGTAVEKKAAHSRNGEQEEMRAGPGRGRSCGNPGACLRGLVLYVSGGISLFSACATAGRLDGAEDTQMPGSVPACARGPAG